MATLGGFITQLSLIMPPFPIEFDGVFFVPNLAMAKSQGVTVNPFCDALIGHGQISRGDSHPLL